MTQKVKILIVEDEGIIAEHLRMILFSYGFDHIKIAHSKENALLGIIDFKPDLVLLDIHLKQHLDGIEIAKIVHEKYHIPFVFITAHSDPLILNKALECQPAGYITKPFNQANVYATINIAIKQVKDKEEDYITIKDGFDMVKFDLNSILYVESEGNYIDIITENSKKSLRHSLEWFMQQVSDKKFMRVHRSYVIPLAKIKKIAGSEVIIENHTLPISRKYLSELKQKLKST